MLPIRSYSIYITLDDHPLIILLIFKTIYVFAYLLKKEHKVQNHARAHDYKLQSNKTDI